jgi:hypothetical protein
VLQIVALGVKCSSRTRAQPLILLDFYIERINVYYLLVPGEGNVDVADTRVSAIFV